MVPKAKNPVTRGRETGPSNVDLRAANDTRDPTKNSSKKQVHDRARSRILVARLHGPALLAYFLDEIDCGASVDESLESYSDLPGDLIEAFGADQFPPPLHAIDGGKS